MITEVPLEAQAERSQAEEHGVRAVQVLHEEQGQLGQKSGELPQQHEG